jgi:RNA polymerase sigma factor (TIGR02999 family)
MSADLTSLLLAASRGSPDAQDALISAVYQELRQIAGSLMRMERLGHTLQPTALVNEAYLRLFRGEPKWENRAHFFGAAARAMRRILIESARQKLALRRGGGAEKVTFGDLQVQAEDPQLNLLALDEALSGLQDVDPRLVKVVELRYFAGCSVEETAEILRASSATIKRDWNYARAWLYDRMSQ